MNVKSVALTLLCAATLYGAQIPASAVSQDALNMINIPIVEYDSTNSLNNAARATNHLDWSVSPGTMKKGTVTFSLAKNEIVTINCAYTPTSANVDIGLYSSEGTFYYVNATNGSLDASIKIPKTGTYYIAVRNNFKSTIKIIGSINY